MTEKLGRVVIAPDVLLTIVRLTTLSIPGVVRMSGSLTEGMDRFLGRPHVGEGVRLEVDNDMVTVDVHVIVRSEVNMLKLGRVIQSEVTRAVSDMVGMGVERVNVHIENVEVDLQPPRKADKQ
jgi:uncharacterized alkaline shock family protein YloU